jgi:hypothetical protein
LHSIPYIPLWMTFQGTNQIKITLEDKEKTIFVTPRNIPLQSYVIRVEECRDHLPECHDDSFS